MEVLRYTIFDSLPEGNGAEKRTAQITEILDDAGIKSKLVKKQDTTNIGIAEVLFRTIPVIRDLTKVIPLHLYKNLKSVLRVVRDYIQTERLLFRKLDSDIKVLLWECTRSDNFFVPLLARKYGKKIIALPHNLESLVPNQVSTISLKRAPEWYLEEILYLSVCDLVFCISKEDTFFVKLFGINAHYLPYFPTRDTETFYLNIREKRKNRSRADKKLRNLLMLGSANNQPTRLGMIDRIKFFSSKLVDNVKLTIAGFYTDTLSCEIDFSNSIRLAGSLNSDQLERELLETDAILIHQTSSSGALTRIIEMLLAGIPVILNFESSKDYSNIDGLYVYNNDEQFTELLKSNLDNNIKVPMRPIRNEKLFSKSIIS
jgi:hypothetical protein